MATIQSIMFDDTTSAALDDIKAILLTKNTSYIVRTAVVKFKNFLANNSSVGIFQQNNEPICNVPSLPGMTERIVRSQMIRWDLTADEYNTIVRQTIDEYAANGQAMKNPEAAIFGACRRYVDGKNGKTAAPPQQPQPATATTAEHNSTIDEMQELIYG